MCEQGFPVGYHIQSVRAMTDEELKREGWTGSVVCIDLSDGSTIYAAKDYANSSPGVLAGRLATGEHFTVG